MCDDALPYIFLDTKPLKSSMTRESSVKSFLTKSSVLACVSSPLDRHSFVKDLISASRGGLVSGGGGQRCPALFND